MNKTATPLYLCLFIMHVLSTTHAHGQIEISFAANPPLCGGFSTGSILATVTGGASPYTFNWSNGDTGNPITGLPSGMYSLTVTDQNGNTGEDSIALASPPPLHVPISVTSCSPPGAMTAMPSGGTPPYSLIWNTGDTTASISGLPLGQYCITVLDDNNCAFINCQYIGKPLSASVETTNAACNNPYGGGTAHAMVTGGIAPFSYKWDNGLTGSLIDSLPAGPLAVTITGYNGCNTIVQDTVGLEENPLGIQIDFAEPTCENDSSGWATALAAGAYLPAKYFWNTGDSTSTITQLPAGSYSVTIADAMGCTGNKSVTLENQSDLQLSLIAEQPTCFGVNNGRLKANIQSGIAPYKIEWSTGDTTLTLEDLSAGLYFATVTDDVGCIQIDSAVLSYPDPLESNLLVTNASHCAAMDGKIVPVLSGGGTGPFLFQWSNGSSDSILLNVPAGNYAVTITSAEGCEVSDSGQVNQPNTLNVSVFGTSLVCGNENNGMLTASVQYGTGPYEYHWNNGASTSSIQNLGPGVYKVTVTSAEGCKGFGAKTIFNSPSVGTSSLIDSISCNGSDDGSISISIQSGLPPFSILWSTGSTQPAISQLGSGSYSVTVTDIAGCTTTTTFQLAEPAILMVQIDSDPGTCGSSATMEVMPSGGTSPYQFLWSTGETSEQITTNQGGNFSVTVTDSHGCSAVENINLPDSPGIELGVSGTDESCFGAHDGVVIAEASGGTPPFQYSWNTGDVSNTLQNLPSGNYSVTVTDFLGCTRTESLNIAPGPALAIDVVAPQFNCAGQTVAAVVVPPQNATLPLSYSWSDGQEQQTASGLTSGIYFITVTDGLGCSGIDSVQILPGGDFDIDLIQNDISCAGESDGQIQLEIQGGILPISITWSNGATGPELQNLSPGNYIATISETTSGCTKSISTEIFEPSALNVSLTAENGTCGNPATAEVSIFGGSPPWTVEWNTGDTTTSIEATSSGDYNVQVIDANGCLVSSGTYFEVDLPPIVEIELVNYPESPQIHDGSLVAQYSNLTSPVTVSWDSGQLGDTLTGLSTGEYFATITDIKGCSAEAQYLIPQFARIGDFVWFDENRNGVQDSLEAGVEGIEISVSGISYFGTTLDKSISSDASGKYGFDLPPGEYQLTFVPVAEFAFSNPHEGSSPEFDSDVNQTTGATALVQVAAGETRLDIDAGLIEKDTCDNLDFAGKICCDGSFCYPNEAPLLLSEQEAAAGGNGTIIYQWYQSEIDNVFDPATWQKIPNSNSAELEVDPTENTYYVRAGKRENCNEEFPSNKVEISVTPLLSPQIIAPDSICTGSGYSFQVELPELGAQYSWNFSSSASIAQHNGPLVPFVTWGQNESSWVSLTTEKDGCNRIDTISLDGAQNCSADHILLRGKLIGNDAKLWWEWPASLLQESEFEVQWAVPSSASFTKIPTIDSMYISPDSAYFEAIHHMPQPGKNYYRLKISSTSGEVAYSNVVELIFGENADLVVAYPNPFSKVLTLQVIDDYNSKINYQLVDALGRTWLKGQLLDTKTVKKIPTEDITSGVYFLQIIYDDALVKMVKLIRK